MTPTSLPTPSAWSASPTASSSATKPRPRMAMRAIALITLLLATASAAEAEPRKLTLQEAVSLALHVDPLISEAHLGNDRARLGVLRAQLDRFSLKVDGSV